MATLQIKPEMLQTRQSRAFTVSLHRGEDRVACPGGLSFIIAPRARELTCVQLRRSCEEPARIHEEMGEDQRSPPCHPKHWQPQLAAV